MIDQIMHASRHERAPMLRHELLLGLWGVEKKLKTRDRFHIFNGDWDDVCSDKLNKSIKDSRLKGAVKKDVVYESVLTPASLLIVYEFVQAEEDNLSGQPDFDKSVLFSRIQLNPKYFSINVDSVNLAAFNPEIKNKRSVSKTSSEK